MRGQVTRRSDIYSYGVLLIEIVTGQCNTNIPLAPDVAPDERYILEMVRSLGEITYDDLLFLKYFLFGLNLTIFYKTSCHFPPYIWVTTIQVPHYLYSPA